MSKHKVENVDKKMVVEFLAATLREMRDAGLMVAVKNVAGRPDRPAGIIIYTSEIQLGEGGLAFLEAGPATEIVETEIVEAE